MRTARYWVPAFLVLFACYQAPQALRTPMLMLAFLPVAWLVARALKLGMGAAYALEWNRSTAWLLGGGFLLALLAKFGSVLIGAQLGLYQSSPRGVPLQVFFEALAWTSVFTFVPSIAEDILTRGFWARVPGWRWTAWRFVLFSSGIYVLNHIYRLGNGPTEWLMLFCFGIAYATALWRTGSLWAAIGLHWGWNFTGAMIGPWWFNAQPGAAWWLSSITHLLLAMAYALYFKPAAGVSDPRESSPAPAGGT